MIVIDASVLANVVGDDGEAGRVARAVLAEEGAASIPDLADVETVAVLRKRWLAGTLTDARLRAAVGDLGALPLTRFPTMPLMHRALELRRNLTPYDACYVALAEEIPCDLVTADRRLSRAPGIRCRVRILPGENSPGE
ncbi:MAG: type II toxin-antitoxin system VapC family toxin [Actinobacteria bacterium]|nr:type II toxin-antitoxin system VapC family toxin [Actinomycetota bacterium]